ncbi:hypothetical protein GQ42DRAFT_172292 [Ramicandelaber brevisporus]|nr:hypothetical protein GQ42DRAFT_172292 [Ramicandelaber brevisporus]
MRVYPQVPSQACHLYGKNMRDAAGQCGPARFSIKVRTNCSHNLPWRTNEPFSSAHTELINSALCPVVREYACFASLAFRSLAVSSTLLMILLFVFALLVLQLAGAAPQQTPSPTTAQTPTPTLPLTPTPTVPTPPPPLVSSTSTSFAATGWPVATDSSMIPALPDMDQPWAVRILLKPTSTGTSTSSSSSSSDDLSNAILLADSQTSNKLAVARWNFNGPSVAQRNLPVRNVTYFLNQPLPGLSAQPGMVGLAAIYANTTPVDMYRNVRRALGFAQKNEFTHLLLYADNSTSVKEFDVAPAEPDVPLGPDGLPGVPPNYAQSPLSPYGGSARNVPPAYQHLFPFLDGIDLDALQLFRLTFNYSITNTSVIILESNTGSRMASLLSSNQRARTLVQDSGVHNSIFRPPPPEPPLAPGKITAIIVAGVLILLGIIARVLYVKQ